MTSPHATQITKDRFIKLKPKRTAPLPAPKAPGLAGGTLPINDGQATFLLRISYSPMHEKDYLTIYFQGSHESPLWMLNHGVNSAEAASSEINLDIPKSVFASTVGATLTLTYRLPQEEPSAALTLTVVAH